MKLSNIPFFAFFLKLNPYRLPTLEEKRTQMLNQTKVAVVKTHMTTLELQHTLEAKCKILNDLLGWREVVANDSVLLSGLYLVDERIAQIENIIFDLETDLDVSSATTHMNKVRMHRIAEQLQLQ